MAQLCQDQKRKEFEKQNELTEVQKLIRGKNDQLEEWKIRVKQCSDKQKKLKVIVTLNSPLFLCRYLYIYHHTPLFPSEPRRFFKRNLFICT